MPLLLDSYLWKKECMFFHYFEDIDLNFALKNGRTWIISIGLKGLVGRNPKLYTVPVTQKSGNQASWTRIRKSSRWRWRGWSIGGPMPWYSASYNSRHPPTWTSHPRKLTAGTWKCCCSEPIHAVFPTILWQWLEKEASKWFKHPKNSQQFLPSLVMDEIQLNSVDTMSRPNRPTRP